jgi:N-methylhydantoinase B
MFRKNEEAADPSGLTFLDPGDSISFVSAGGGGYGDPLERDPEAVLRDVRFGYVSPAGARREYGVVVDPETLTLDLEATRALRRDTARERRLP